MEHEIKLLERLYELFNARDIESILEALTDDVAWANGMEGGHVFGAEALRAYWLHQWSMVDPRVEPRTFQRINSTTILADVIQTVFDLEGNPLQETAHGLRDRTVGHIFTFRDGKVARFDIQDDE